MNTSRWLCFATIVAILVFTNSCGKSSVSQKDKPSDVKLEPRVSEDEPPSVLFDIKPLTASPDSAGFRLYDCAYSAEGKTARFRLEFKQGRSSGGEFPTASGEGKFLAVAGSESSVLLRDLTKALDGKQTPHSLVRVKELAFDAVVLGENQTRGSSGFSDKPRGNWTTIKIFLPSGGDDAELFLNLNPVEGKGEFSMKDSDYADYLLKEFAKVL